MILTIDIGNTGMMLGVFAENELREKLDAFFGLLKFHGVKNEINSYRGLFIKNLKIY